MSACVVRDALLGVTLAEHIDEWIVHCGRLGRPLERIALTRSQIDALHTADLLELHHRNTPTGDLAVPFYRGFPVVEQGNKNHE